MQHLGGQLRIGGTQVLGWDMTAALAIARGLGCPENVAADFLPEIEGVMVRRMNAHNAHMETPSDG